MIQNMRDLGGIRTQDGLIIRPHMLIRSAQLAQATKHDLEHISTVIDLRTPGERKETPDQTCGCQYLPIPLFDDAKAGISHEGGAESQLMPDMAFLYGKLADECADAFRRVLTEIMRHDFSRGGVLWHCTEGKDRCGVTTALVLEILGVDRGIILQDYLKTNDVNLPKAAAIRGRLAVSHGEAFAESVYQAYIADERYLNAAWAAMGDRYVQDRLGLDTHTIGAFRRAVLEADV